MSVQYPHWVRNTIIRFVVCLTDPLPVPRWGPQRVKSAASSLNIQNPVLSWSSFCSCLRLLSRLPIPSILPLKKCFKRQFPRKMWTFQLPFIHFIVRMIVLSSLTPCHTSFFIRRAELSFSVLPKHQISRISASFVRIFRNTNFSTPYRATLQSVAHQLFLS